MNMQKKKVLVASLAVCLVAILSMGTLAWFNAQDEVTNKFEVLSSLTSFKVDVWEEVPDADNDGALDEVGKNALGPHDYTYENVEPNKDYTKVMYVENNSGNALAGQYIKMEVTFTKYSVLYNMVKELTSPQDCATAMLKGANFSPNENGPESWWYDPTDTRCYHYDANEDEATFTFYLKEVLSNGSSVKLFEKVWIPDTMDINDAAALQPEGFQIKAVAYAIQSANIADPNGTSVLDNVLYAFANGYYGNSTGIPDYTVTP